MSTFDPFALGGRQDDAALALFQQWIDAARDADATVDENEAEYDSALKRMDKAETDIAACSGAKALAMKTFFIFRYEHANWAPEPYVRIRTDEWNCPLLLAALRDAGDLVPEIAEFAAPIFHEDAELIDADIQVTWARQVLADDETQRLPDFMRDRQSQWRIETQGELATALNTIATTEAKTARGEAIKAKHAGCAS